MFIERSAGRIRAARILFLAAGLLPCVALGAWALHLRSAAHREAVRVRWQQVVGLPLTIGTLEHPRPGVVRAHGCGLAAATGGRVIVAATVEVESAVGEDRLRIDSVRVDAEAAAVIGDLAREWLRRDARHPRNCVIEVADFAWGEGRPEAAAADRAGPVALRVECVAQDGSRAVRVVRHAAVEDELRVVRTLADDDGRLVERVTVDASCSDPVPLAILAAVVGWGPESVAAAGPTATARGEIAARLEGDGWSGSVRGRIDHVDLRACAAAVGSRGAGEAGVAVDRLSWRAGRLEDVAAECVAGPGWIDAALLDRMVIALGCKPGAAATSGEPVRAFDAAGVVLSLDGSRLVMRGPPSIAGAVAVRDTVPVLAPPSAAVPFERLAWMLSPPAASFVPAAGPGAWLMSILPGSAGIDAAGQKRASNPSSGEGRRDF